MKAAARLSLVRPTALTLSISSALFASGVMAAAQENVEELVITASGISQRIVDAPASISVVGAIELQKRPYITLIDAVRELEGVDVGETSDKTGQRSISMRGMGSDYTLLLIDGKRQNNHGDIYPNSFGGNQFNHIPPLETIERIEVIRGPASTLYGADALGGVINIITKRNTERWRGSVTAGHSIQENKAFGTDTTYDFALHGPLIRGILGASLRGSLYDRKASAPEYEIILDPAGGEHERVLGFGGGGKTVNNTNQTLGFTLNWTPTEAQRISFDYDISQQEYDNTPYFNNLGTPTYPLGTVDGIDSIWRATAGVVQPRAGYSANQQFDREQWSVTHDMNWGGVRSLVSLAHIDTSNAGRTLPFTVGERLQLQQMWSATGAYAGLSTAERRSIAEATFLPRPSRDLASSQYTLDAKVDIPIEDFGGRHHLVVGTQVIDGELEDGVFGMEAGPDRLPMQQKQQMYSLFIEDNWTLIDPLTITFGLRRDDHKIFGDQLSPRLYGVYTISDEWTVKGGVSTGFKTPKTTDLYDGVTGFGSQGVSPFVGNPFLKPETSMNKEVGFYWTSAEAGHNFNVTYFVNDFDDKIARGETNQSCEQTGGVRPCANLGAYGELNYTSYAQNINIDKARIKGAEVVGRYQISESLSVRANYTWTDSEQLSGPQMGEPLTNTAKDMVNGTLDWFMTDAFSMQLTLESRSDRFRGIDANGNHMYFKAYNVWHLGSQYRFNERLTLSARINNVLDQDFTSFETSFNQNADGSYTPTYLDNYNNKDKARNLWLSLNMRF
jgi:outer membrane receptor for ferrienterochelin and colicins